MWVGGVQEQQEMAGVCSWLETVMYGQAAVCPWATETGALLGCPSSGEDLTSLLSLLASQRNPGGQVLLMFLPCDLLSPLTLFQPLHA